MILRNVSTTTAHFLWVSLAILSLFAACGWGAEGRYVNKLNEIVGQYNDDVHNIDNLELSQSLALATDTDTLLLEIRKWQAAMVSYNQSLTDALNELSTLSPPEKYMDLHNSYVRVWENTIERNDLMLEIIDHAESMGPSPTMDDSAKLDRLIRQVERQEIHLSILHSSASTLRVLHNISR